MQYRLLKKLQDELFDPSQLDRYALLLSIGTRELQLAVVEVSKHRCLLTEDYALEGVQTTGDRMRLLKGLFAKHLFVQGGFWKEVKCILKGHKFTLMPRTLYAKENAAYFLSLNATINEKTERLYAHLHKRAGLVNVFAADHQLVGWLEKLYGKKKLALGHQGSALIEASLQYYKAVKQKAMLFLVDKKVLHVVLCENNRLYYYNQFAVQDAPGLVRYVQLVFSELGLGKSQQTRVVFYGNVPSNSAYIRQLKKQIPQLQIGTRPKFLQFPFPFDDVSEHHYLDLFSTYLCGGFYAL